ncbi:hypothetical protein B484DRAFT_397818 [Ochromonadaceae sp. CCMP2298]|nr:hypothetical protein B484DRAFT_397818 [Ochromonadaceae sp. CCMP2298]
MFFRDAKMGTFISPHCNIGNTGRMRPGIVQACRRIGSSFGRVLYKRSKGGNFSEEEEEQEYAGAEGRHSSIGVGSRYAYEGTSESEEGGYGEGGQEEAGYSKGGYQDDEYSEGNEHPRREQHSLVSVVEPNEGYEGEEEGEGKFGEGGEGDEGDTHQRGGHTMGSKSYSPEENIKMVKLVQEHDAWTKKGAIRTCLLVFSRRKTDMWIEDDTKDVKRAKKLTFFVALHTEMTTGKDHNKLYMSPEWCSSDKSAESISQMTAHMGTLITSVTGPDPAATTARIAAVEGKLDEVITANASSNALLQEILKKLQDK